MRYIYQHKINYVLFKILVFFVFFDSLFLKSIFAPVSKIRSVTYIILIILCFTLRGKQNQYPNNINKTIACLFYTFVTIVGVASYDDFVNGSGEGFMIYKQILLFPLFIIIYVNYKKLTGKALESYLLFIIRCASLWVYINFILYFVEIPIWETFRPWFGRISNGYPTVDVVCLNYALYIILFYGNLNVSGKERVFHTLSLVGGIISQFSGTGTVMLIFLLLTSYITKRKCHDIRNSIKICILTLSLSSFFVVGWLSKNQPELTEAATRVATDKFLILVGKQDDLDPWADTMKARSDQYESSKEQFIKTFGDYFVGLGYGNVVMNEVNRSNDIFIEDQYRLNFITIGILGQLLFVLYIVIPFWHWFKFYKNNHDAIFIGIIPILLFLLSSVTTMTMAVFQIEVIFAFFYSILLFPSRNKEIVRLT